MTPSRMRMAYTTFLLLSAAFILWNLADEAWQIGSLIEGILLFASWMAAPTVVAIIGCRSKHLPIQRVNLGLSMCFMLFF